MLPGLSIIVALACLSGEPSNPGAPATAPTVSRSDELPMFFPRFLLIKADYPQLIAVSGGVWLLLGSGEKYQAGPLTNLEVGLSGVTYSLGAGMTSALTASWEHVSAFGVEGLVHRTWPALSPWLASSTTYAGVQAFAHFFAFRCSLGVMWNVSNSEGADAIPIGGCGLGLP